jgi:hypothetical protein
MLRIKKGICGYAALNGLGFVIDKSGATSKVNL